LLLGQFGLYFETNRHYLPEEHLNDALFIFAVIQLLLCWIVPFLMPTANLAREYVFTRDLSDALSVQEAPEEYKTEIRLLRELRHKFPCGFSCTVHKAPPQLEAVAEEWTSKTTCSHVLDCAPEPYYKAPPLDHRSFFYFPLGSWILSSCRRYSTAL
jgi:hypothetical protein